MVASKVPGKARYYDLQAMDIHDTHFRNAGMSVFERLASLKVDEFDAFLKTYRPTMVFALGDDEHAADLFFELGHAYGVASRDAVNAKLGNPCILWYELHGRQVFYVVFENELEKVLKNLLAASYGF